MHRQGNGSLEVQISGKLVSNYTVVFENQYKPKSHEMGVGMYSRSTVFFPKDTLEKVNFEIWLPLFSANGFSSLNLPLYMSMKKVITLCYSPHRHLVTPMLSI